MRENSERQGSATLHGVGFCDDLLWIGVLCALTYFLAEWCVHMYRLLGSSEVNRVET